MEKIKIFLIIATILLTASCSGTMVCTGGGCSANKHYKLKSSYTQNYSVTKRKQ